MSTVQSPPRSQWRGISDRVRAQCHLIAEQARAVTGAPRAILLLYDETAQQLVTVATPGSDVALQQVALQLIRRNYPGLDPLGLEYRPTVNPCVAAAFVGQRTQVNRMAEAFENILPPPVAAIAHGLVGITHVVSCPVVAEGRGLGLIRFLVGQHPSDGQQALMEAAASQIGLTLLNAELAEQARRHLEATRAIGEVARLANGASIKESLRAMAALVRTLTDADAAFICLTDAGGQTFSVVAEDLSDAARSAAIGRTVAATRQIGEGLVGWVIASGEAAFVPDRRLDPRSQPGRLAPLAEAVIAAPMRAGGETFGCVRVSTTGARRFAESDLWLAQALADEAGAFVRSAREVVRSRARARKTARKKAVEIAVQLVESELGALTKGDLHGRFPSQAERRGAISALERLRAMLHDGRAHWTAEPDDRATS